jgi:hypothetical protein
MPEPAWKRFERRVASDHGAFRQRLSGSSGRDAGETRSDSLSPIYYIECKHNSESRLHGYYNETRKIFKNFSGPRGNRAPVPLLQLTETAGGLRLFIFHSDVWEDWAVAEIACDNFPTSSYERARFAVHSLYRDTVEKAAAESKMPVLCLGQRSKPGYLIGVADFWSERYAAARLARDTSFPVWAGHT